MFQAVGEAPPRPQVTDEEQPSPSPSHPHPLQRIYFDISSWIAPPPCGVPAGAAQEPLSTLLRALCLSRANLNFTCLV